MAYAAFANAANDAFASPTFQRNSARVSGTVLVIFGLSLLFFNRFDLI